MHSISQVRSAETGVLVDDEDWRAGAVLRRGPARNCGVERGHGRAG